jgi:hypothetical protein
MTRRVSFPDAFRAVDQAGVFFDPRKEIPDDFQPRGRWKSGPLHTFCDDYRQEFFWRRPEEGLLVALAAGIVTAPDFTAWTDDPLEWRMYQAWRSALVARYWQANGVHVLPVVSFGTGCEQHVRNGSAWAVRGSVDKQWSEDFKRWIDVARPALVVVFGRMPDGGFCIPMIQRRLVSSKVTTAQIEGSHGG